MLLRAARELLGEDGLSARSPVFDRRDALRGWCAQLPGGAPVPVVEQLADHLLAQPGVVPLDRPAAPWRGGAERSFARHTTRDMLGVEQAVIDAALARRDAGVAIANPGALQNALAARPTLSAEQEVMVRQLTGSGAGVEVVVGKAGTGKSHALAAAREAWQASGTPVLGTAVAARAAIALGEAAGMPAMTVARLLTRIERDGTAGQGVGQACGQGLGQGRGLSSGLPRGAVLVVDEAGMLPTRQLARLLAATEQARAKLVLVGDHRQLPELAAGGAFRSLAHRLDPAVLRDNRRQVEPWERNALDRLRDGDIEPALAAYATAGRITASGTGQLQKAALVAAWWKDEAARAPDESARTDGTVMLAADLNARARTLMAANGRLTGPTIQGSGEDEERSFAAGDVVIARRIDYTSGLFNGQRGVITHVNPESGTATMRIKDQDIVVGRLYLAAGSLDHGYALTIHQAQGLTTERALVLGNDSLYRESGYVALSRGRVGNDLYLASQVDNLDPVATESHTPQAADNHRQDPLANLAQTMHRSRAQTMALDQLTGHRQGQVREIDL